MGGFYTVKASGIGSAKKKKKKSGGIHVNNLFMVALCQ